MKKILTLAACAALCTSTLLADIKIGDTPYTSMSEAIKNIQTGEEIIISGTVSIDQAKLRNDNASIIIKGENNAELIIPANIGGIGFIIAKNEFKISNLKITTSNGNPSAPLFECGGGSTIFSNVTFENIITTSSNGIVQVKGSGTKATLNNCTFTNCSGVDNVGLVKVGVDKGLILENAINGLTLMLQNASNSIVADNLTVVSSKIQIYALSATEGRTIVYGSNELSKFNIICASGLKAFAGDNDILCYNESYIPDYVATIGENSYLSWQGLWNASVVATEEPINVSILKNIDVSARYINNVKNTNVIFDGPNDSATLTNTNSNKSQTMFEANAGSTTFKNIKFVSADQRTNSAITVQSRLSIENCDFSNYNTTQNAIYIKNDGTATVSDSKLQSISIAEKGRLNLGANCDIESISIGISAQGKYPCIYVDDNFNDVALTFGDTPDFTLILQKTLISGTADATKFTLPDDVQSYMLKPNADNTGLMLDTKVQNGVEDVMAEDADAPVEWFNLQGIRVANPENGIYIRRQGNKVEKVVL